MEITYRKYTEKDRSTLLQLSKKLSDYSKSIDPMHRVINAPGFSEMEVEDLLYDVKKYNGRIWLAEDKGKMVGYVVGAIWEQSEKNRLEKVSISWVR